MDDMIQVRFKVSEEKLPLIVQILAGEVENIAIGDWDYLDDLDDLEFEIVTLPTSADGPANEPATCKLAEQPE